MKKYKVEFTQTVVVEADSKEEAIEKAYDLVNLDDPYIYVDDEPAN